MNYSARQYPVEKKSQSSLRSGNNRLTHISAYTKPIAKRLIIGAYCRGWLSLERTRALYGKLNLRDC